MAEKTTLENVEAKLIEEKKILLGFWDKYNKQIVIVGGAVLALILGIFAYNQFIKAPAIEKSAEVFFPVESFVDKMAANGFNKDSINIALNGGVADGQKVTGLLQIISKESGTPAANRACYLAGACYLHNKEFDKAIKYLNDFSSNGAYQMDIRKYIMLGDAYSEQKKIDEALNAYKKAATINEKDEPFTSDALMTAAFYAQHNGKSKDAIELYQKIKDNYPASQLVQNGDIDKYLASLGIVK